MKDDSDLSQLKNDVDIIRLHLDRTLVTDLGLNSISTFKKLESLILDDLPISDQGLMLLQNMKTLKRISVKNTMVTPSGVSSLKERLPSLQINFKYNGGE